MSESIEHIKNFNIGDRVTSNTSIMLDRGFRGVTGTIRTIVKDEADSWQYLIDLDDGRELQCDDWHLEQTQLNDNQQIVLASLKNNAEQYALRINPIACMTHLHIDSLEDGSTSAQEAYISLSDREEAQVLEAFAKWVQEQEDEIE